MKNTYLILKLILSIFLISVKFHIIQAQQYEWISDDFPGSRFLDIFEIDGKYYSAVSNGAKMFYDPDIPYQLSIYQIEFSQTGEPGLFLTNVITIPYLGNFATSAVDYISATHTWIVIQSAVISEGLQTYKALIYDESFNIVDSTSIDTLGYPDPCHIDSYNGKTYILGAIQGPPSNELLFVKYSHSNPTHLPNIQITQSEPSPMAYVTDMRINQLNGDLLVYYYNGIAVLDSNLFQKQRPGYNLIRTKEHGHVLASGTYYYSHGLTSQGLGNGSRYLVFHKYDSLFNILFADTFGIKGQDNYPFLTSSIDERNNEFLIGGNLDGPGNSLDFYSHIKKFYLAKYDYEMNQLWYKEYGGDRGYTMFGLKLLDDGSSFAYGTIYDSLNGFRYAYIMHVDENGDVLTSTTIPKENEVSIQIVNPGDETLRILNPDHIEGRIELYDLQGCHMLTGAIDGDVSEINTQFLPPGLYPYVLIKDGHAIGSGKWVKAK